MGLVKTPIRYSILHAAMTTDEFESFFERGVTDGLPVVPPTRERVDRMLAATGRARDELVGEMPPNYGRLSVEKAAVNAVMAGCRPEYLPVVLAAAACACDPAFNLHGVSTSTHFSAPLIVVNGPVRGRIGLNSAFGVFGPGYRANATIGRALRLCMINIGGAPPRGAGTAVPRGPRPAARDERGHAVRGRGAPRHLRPFEPHGAGARGLARLVHGGPVEQQALPALLAHDARGRPRARAHARRRRLGAGRPGAFPPRDGAAAVPRAPARRAPRGGHEPPVRQGAAPPPDPDLPHPPPP